MAQHTIASLKERINNLEEVNSSYRVMLTDKTVRIKQLEEEQAKITKELTDQVQWLRALVSSTFARENTFEKKDGIIQKTWISPGDEFGNRYRGL